MSIEATRMWWCAVEQKWRAVRCDHFAQGCGYLLRTVTHPEGWTFAVKEGGWTRRRDDESA